LDSLEGVLTEGEKIKVKLTGTDPKTGKFKLSRKVLMPKPEGMTEDRRGGDDRQREERPRFENRRDDRQQRDDRPQGERPKIQRNIDGNSSTEQKPQENNSAEENQ
jgi:polyribonucleotide nucleotidyltransferase